MKHVLIGNLSLSKLLKEPLILIDGNFALLFSPDCAKGVDVCSVELDWIVNELRELFDDLLNHGVLTKLTGLWEQFQGDLGTSVKVKVVDIGDLIGAAAIRDPTGALGRLGGLGEDFDMV